MHVFNNTGGCHSKAACIAFMTRCDEIPSLASGLIHAGFRHPADNFLCHFWKHSETNAEIQICVHENTAAEMDCFSSWNRVMGGSKPA